MNKNNVVAFDTSPLLLAHTSQIVVQILLNVLFVVSLIVYYDYVVEQKNVGIHLYYY